MSWEITLSVFQFSVSFRKLRDSFVCYDGTQTSFAIKTTLMLLNYHCAQFIRCVIGRLKKFLPVSALLKNGLKIKREGTIFWNAVPNTTCHAVPHFWWRGAMWRTYFELLSILRMCPCNFLNVACCHRLHFILYAILRQYVWSNPDVIRSISYIPHMMVFLTS